MNKQGFLWRSNTVSEELWLAQTSGSALWKGVDALPVSWVPLSGDVLSATPTPPIHTGISASSSTDH